jgi:hypothetical protein
MPTLLRSLSLLICVLFGWTGAADAAEQQAKAVERNAPISFRTLDGDSLQVDLDQIWRIRAAITRDEPAGATVIDYAFERLFVGDPLETVVEKIREQRDIKQFTLPSGAPIFIFPEKIIGIKRSIPNQHHRNTRSILIAREGEQQVQESRQAIRDLLGK